jgi:chemotaxis protein MotA
LGKRDYGTVLGVAIAGAAVAGGFLLERGRIADLASLNAALLVFGGTAVAVCLGTPSSVLLSAVRRCRGIFHRHLDERTEVADRIMRFASLARRLGISAIESEAEALENGPLRRALLLIVDGAGPEEVRRQMQIDIAVAEEQTEADARVFDQAGGYAPTIGIIGAVIGLIQVMTQLGDVEAVGHGIAAAFTATLYGVALANMILLPLGARIRARGKSVLLEGELILEGVSALGDGLSPRLIRTRLETFLQPDSIASLNLVSTPSVPKAERMSA